MTLRTACTRANRPLRADGLALAKRITNDCDFASAATVHEEKINDNRAIYQTIRADSRYASFGHE
jgi:hypothetical protein